MFSSVDEDFVANSSQTSDIENKYVLDYDNGVAVFVSVSDETNLEAFRGYVVSSGDVIRYEISHDATLRLGPLSSVDAIYSVDGILYIVSDKVCDIALYSVDGCKAYDLHIIEGLNSYDYIRKGIYLMNNRKVIVR